MSAKNKLGLAARVSATAALAVGLAVSFQPSASAAAAVSEYGCDKSTAKDVVSDAQGKVNTTIVVHSSFEAVVTADGAVWGTVDAKTTQTQVGLGSDTGEGGGQVVTFK